MTQHSWRGSSWWIAAALGLGACADKGSLGGYEGTGYEGTGYEGTGSEGATGSEGGETSSDGSGATSSATEDTGNTTTTPSCDQPGNCAMYPAPCGETCGAVESNFDDDGCLRGACQQDEECGGDERCFRGMDFGLCEASGIFCQDNAEEMSCLCSSDPECGGGHCVPAELYPPTIEDQDFTGPVLSNDCGPDDGPLLVFVMYGDGAYSDCVITDGVEELRLEFDGVLEVGEYEFAFGSGGSGTHRNDAGDLEEVQYGQLVIDSTDGDTYSGSYRAVVGGAAGLRVLEGALSGEDYCPQPVVCG
ncbi:MAG: hypothetical protein JNK45_06555 [Myxococcales bacterium]|nr:hypothetical protein [Myxococcales bacterium]